MTVFHLSIIGSIFVLALIYFSSPLIRGSLLKYLLVYLCVSISCAMILRFSTNYTSRPLDLEGFVIAVIYSSSPFFAYLILKILNMKKNK